MTLNEYQERALETAIFKQEYKILYPALKLAGEAGEVAEKVGKVLRDNDGDFDTEKRKELAKELGDVLWYVAALSNSLGFTLNQIGFENIQKLASRRERGMIHGNGDNR